MTNRIPSIACIGIIGKENNPLHISLFPPYSPSPSSSSSPSTTPSSPSSPTTSPTTLTFSLLLSTSLDIFAARLPSKPIEQDFGLLQAVDERLAMYGYLTNTGVKFVVIVDMEGREAPHAEGNNANTAKGKIVPFVGLRDADVKPIFRALQTLYIALLRNPFYDPDTHTPSATKTAHQVGSTQITSRRFIDGVRKIGKGWIPGVAVL